MTDLLLYAMAAGLMLVTATGPLGTIIVWQRMAYYGDTLAHSALLGVALGLMLETSIELSVVTVCVVLALGLGPLHRISGHNLDSLLGIASHTSLALGLVAVSLQSGNSIDLNSFLFGDILAVNLRDLLLLGAVSGSCVVLLMLNWNGLVALAAHRDLAQVEGRAVVHLEVLQMVLIALVVAVGMKIVGVLLISALLIIPATAAGSFSRSPEGVALSATALGMISVIGGMLCALQLDIPAGPAIVLFASLLFFLSLLSRYWKRTI
ncbi:metal ABC transporter permease [Litorivivens sp.]|uniref:metal ABC transporter permease n=1 Tax=Litorivivens sp. TaxID=2020868 RepID=UPI00356900FF